MKKQKVLKYICYTIYILSPLILLLFLSFICNQNVFMGKPTPYGIWNDEVGYWREIFSFAECGFNTGYIGINELIPKVGQFSTHGFFPPLFYYPFAKILNWPTNGIMISNLIFTIICFSLIVVLYKPNISQTVMLTCLYSFFSPIILFAATSMTEILNYGFLALFFIFFYKYYNSEKKYKKYFLFLTILIGTICSFYRIIYIVLLLLLILILSNFKPKKFIKLLVPYILYSGFLYYIISIFTAPYQFGVLYSCTHTSNIKLPIQVLLSNCKSNIKNLFNLTNGSKIEVYFRLFYLFILTIYLLCVFLNLTIKKSKNNFLTLSLRERINRFYIIQFALLFLPLFIIVVIYDVHSCRDFRSLSPFLWISFFNLIIYKRTFALKFFKPIFMIFFIINIIVWPNNYYMNDSRYADTKKRNFTLIQDVVQYDMDVIDPFENTIATDVVFDFELWSNLHPGIGIEWLTPNFNLENCKSKYLLINKNQNINGYENKGKTEFGYLYEKKKVN